MITTIKGVLTESTPLRAVVEVNGLGYEVHVPITTAEKLPQVGSPVRLFTFVAYREDAQTMYGFAEASERDFFKLMIDTVSGVGPKMALSIMSKLSVPVLESAIRMGDLATLSSAQGIGKKLAERLVVELKGKLGSVELSKPSTPEQAAPSSPQRDAVSALMALGYKAADADTAVRRAALALGAGAATEALIKKALG